ncbi:MAG TPA: hypothetical protein VK358_09325 [Longimicrobium sp.]|nr:hypothetical protein [Longimicrobium sp.]
MMMPESLRNLFRRSAPARGVTAVPLIRTPQPRLREIDREERFAAVMEQSQGSQCSVIIQGGIDNPAGGITWYDLEVVWVGPWSRDSPLPTTEDVVATVRVEGLRYGRHVVRANI